MDRKSAIIYVPNVVATAATRPPAPASSDAAEVDLVRVTTLLETFFERPKMEVADLENNILLVDDVSWQFF